MKSPLLSVRNRSLATKATVALLLVATPGFGFIVFDPTVAANVIKEIKESIQAVSTAKSTLSTLQANVKSFSLKKLWQTAQGTLPPATVGNLYGETAGWSTALNMNSLVSAAAAWDMSNVKVTPSTSLATETPGQSSNLSSLALVEAFDASSPNCLNAVGQYRGQRAANAAAENALETDQLDGSAATNSEIEQLNLLNAADAQHMHEIESQGQLHACLAEQTTIANMAQRNAAAIALNDASIAEQERVSNNTNLADGSTTWQGYLP